MSADRDPSGRARSQAEYFIGVRRFDRALEALAGEPACVDDGPCWRLRAFALSQLERTDEARKAIEQAIRLDGDEPEHMAVLAVIEADARRPSRQMPSVRSVSESRRPRAAPGSRA